MSRDLALVLSDLRSAYNVGSILRTAEGLGVKFVYLTGTTPYPQSKNDPRPPHERLQVSAKIRKSALGAENSVKWTYRSSIELAIIELRNLGYRLVALEQTPEAKSIYSVRLNSDLKIAIIVGNEVAGLNEHLIERSKFKFFIPMAGKKESFNVAVAAALAIQALQMKE